MEAPTWVQDAAAAHSDHLVGAIRHKFNEYCWVLAIEGPNERKFLSVSGRTTPETKWLEWADAYAWANCHGPEHLQTFLGYSDEPTVHVDADADQAARDAHECSEREEVDISRQGEAIDGEEAADAGSLPEYQPHELCRLVPRMHPDDFEALKLSLQRSGGLGDSKIVLFEDQILDGRHRYEACVALDLPLTPEDFEEFQGTYEDARTHVQQKLTHRSLNTVEKAAVAVELFLPEERTNAHARRKVGGELREDLPTGRATARAGNRVGVSRKAIEDVERIKDEAPHVFEDIQKGRHNSVAQAKRAAKVEADVYLEAREVWLAQPPSERDWDDAIAEVRPEDPVGANDSDVDPVEDTEGNLPAEAATEEHAEEARPNSETEGSAHTLETATAPNQDEDRGTGDNSDDVTAKDAEANAVSNRARTLDEEAKNPADSPSVSESPQPTSVAPTVLDAIGTLVAFAHDLPALATEHGIREDRLTTFQQVLVELRDNYLDTYRS